MTSLPAPSHWNASAYTRISSPQFSWGSRVLDRIALTGHEVVIDAGCGSGQLTERLCERLPHGQVIALDSSAEMLEEARSRLAPRFGARVRFMRADLQDLAIDGVADVIFSTATFHWVLDHERLFAGLYRALVPGGRLHAQCGGGPILMRLRQRVNALIARPPFAPFFAEWRDNWHFPDRDTTATRLANAGFDAVETWLEETPTVFNSAAEMKEFLRNVTLRAHSAALATESLRDAFFDRLVAESAGVERPFTLDFWRLNLHARKPTLDT